MNVASGRVPARRLEQVERAVGVDAEVRLRVGRGPVVRRLRGGVDDELDLAARARAKTPLDAVGVADVDVERAEARRASRQSRSVTVRGRGLRAEEARAHVVLEPDHVEARLDEVRDRLGADQPARAGDDRDWHARPSRAPRATARSLSSIQSKMSASTSRGRRAAAASRCARTAARSRRGRCGTSPGRVSADALDRRPSLPVSSRQSSVVSSSDRLHVAPAADVDGHAVPALGVAASCSSIEVDEVVDVEQVAHLLARCRRSRCSARSRPK